MILRQMLNRYGIKTSDDHFNALREVMQEIALAGLYRGGFFEKGAFYGGTALRILYKLDRFSEDLDFSLLKPDKTFRLEPYFKTLQEEFEAYGITVDITQKQKKIATDIESAFLKSGTDMHILMLDSSDVELPPGKKIRIKFEIDTNPPLKFQTEERLLLQPFSFYVKCFTASSLYAGKMHALLFRKWKNRVKGRDWYDFEWYVKNGFSLNLEHLTARAIASGNIEKDAPIDETSLRKMLVQKIETLDVEMAKNDVAGFIKDQRVLDIWSKEYFLELSGRIVTEQN